MRSHPTYAVLLLCLAGCATTPELTPTAQKPSTFTEQTEADTAVDAAPAAPLPIRAIPNQHLPIQAVTTAAQIGASSGPLAGIITKAPASTLPIVPVGANSVWTLTTGHTVGQELQAWGETAGWKVIWSMPKDWTVPATTSFSGDFKSAASDVIKTLSANGALVRAQFYDGNKTMIVTGPGVVPQ